MLRTYRRAMEAKEKAALQVFDLVVSWEDFGL